MSNPINLIAKLAGLSADEQQQVAAAAAKHELEPGQLLDFAVYPGRVVVILPDGRKISYSLADLAGFFSEAAGKLVNTRKK